MILCASADNRFMEIEAVVLANKYGEEKAIFRTGCLNKLGNESRLTILGHGNPSLFGDDELTPQQFVADLLSYCPSGRLPDSVKIIDFVACGVGEDVSEIIDSQNTTSFVKKVTETLIAKGYPHIQVNAFTNAVMPEPISDIFVRTNTIILGSGIELYGLDTKAKLKFDHDFAEVMKQEPLGSLKTKCDELLKQKMALHSQIRELKLSSGEEKSHIEKLELQLKDIMSEYNESQKKISSARIRTISGLLDKMGILIYKGDDIRRSLDFNANFHHTQSTLQAFPLLSKERRNALIMLNNRIAELKEEWFVADKSSGLFSYLFVSDSAGKKERLAYQMSEFAKLAEIMANPRKDMDAVYSAMHSALQDEKLDGKKNRILADFMLNNFSIDEAALKWKGGTLSL